MKFKIITASLYLSLLLFSNPGYADEDCDWFCNANKFFSNILGNIDDVGDGVTGIAAKVGKMTSTYIAPLPADIIVYFQDNPPRCADIFADAGIPNFDPENPTTDDFTNARLFAGIPLDFIKNAIPSDTFSVVQHTAALFPYYAYVWCEATLERDMINADTDVRDGYHNDILTNQQAILDGQATIIDNQETIIANQAILDGKLDVITDLLNTPSGKRGSWNK